MLRSKDRVFVLVGPEVKGIITLADLNKPLVRVYLFGLVSLLEMHLRFWVSTSYGQDDWKHELKEDRLRTANEFKPNAVTGTKKSPCLIACSFVTSAI